MPYPLVKLEKAKEIPARAPNNWTPTAEIRYSELNSKGQLKFLKFIKEKATTLTIRNPNGPGFADIHKALTYLDIKITEIGYMGQGINTGRLQEISSYLYWLIIQKKELSNYQLRRLARSMCVTNYDYRDFDRFISHLNLED